MGTAELRVETRDPIAAERAFAKSGLSRQAEIAAHGAAPFPRGREEMFEGL
jgi:hypothetical protein